MHDKNGTPVKRGDIVLIPAVIVSASPNNDFCNLDVETLHGQRPDGRKNTIYALNTAQVILLEKKDGE